MKNIRVFYLKNCQFLEVKFSIYLNSRVFVMNLEGRIFVTIFLFIIRRFVSKVFIF